MESGHKEIIVPIDCWRDVLTCLTCSTNWRERLKREMILQSVMIALRARLAAITIELVIVVVGVFIGTAVANWNERRLEMRATEHLLSELKPELHEVIEFFDSARRYYSATRSYADVASLGGRRKGVSDDQFVSTPTKLPKYTDFRTAGKIGHWFSAPSSCAVSRI